MRRATTVALLILAFLMVTSTIVAQEITTVQGLRAVLEGTWTVTGYSAVHESDSGVPWVAQLPSGPAPERIEFNTNGVAVFDEGAVRLWSVQVVGSLWAAPCVRLTGENEVAYLVPLWVNAERTEMDALLIASDAPVSGYAEYLKLRRASLQ